MSDTDIGDDIVQDNVPQHISVFIPRARRFSLGIEFANNLSVKSSGITRFFTLRESSGTNFRRRSRVG